MERGRIVRVSVSLPQDLLRKFDEAIERVGYSDRSKAVRDAMQNLITESKWMCEKMGRGIGAVVLVYDHDVKDLDEELTEIQHRHGHLTVSSMHVHLDKSSCLEIIAVNGNAWEVRDLAQELRTRKGVKHLKLAIVTP